MAQPLQLPQVASLVLKNLESYIVGSLAARLSAGESVEGVKDIDIIVHPRDFNTALGYIGMMPDPSVRLGRFGGLKVTDVQELDIWPAEVGAYLAATPRTFARVAHNPSTGVTLRAD